MAIWERIRFLRNLKRMTQKHLGMQISFSEKATDIHMAQYKRVTCTPKANSKNSLEKI